MAVSVIKEANRSGCRISRACEALGVSKRTFERWQKNMEGDRRRGPISPPANKFSPEEKRRIIETVASSEFCDKSPAQIVPLLADQGKYLGSESSFYRILRAEGMQLGSRKRLSVFSCNSGRGLHPSLRFTNYLYLKEQVSFRSSPPSTPWLLMRLPVKSATTFG